MFFPVFPTLGVQNLFFPGRYLPVNTAVKTGYRPKPSNPAGLKWSNVDQVLMYVILHHQWTMGRLNDNLSIDNYISSKCRTCLSLEWVSNWFKKWLLTCSVPSHYLTHWPLGDLKIFFKMSFSNSYPESIPWAIPAKLLSEVCHRTPLMISQHCFR